jgi:hypothetical protein
MPLNRDVYKAVVRLTNTSKFAPGKSLGSGVVFGRTGLVITNNHVIEDIDFGTAFGEITVETLQSVDQPPAVAVPAEVVIRNEVYDLAVVKITGAPPQHFIDLPRTPRSDASLMERRIRVLGYPPLGGGTLTVTRGIVSGFDEVGNLKTDAEINPGNSGGAGSLPGTKKFFLGFAGIHGDKKAGIQQLGIAAEHGHYLRPFAKILLALAALREKKTQVARTQLKELVAEFPENPLFASELAKLKDSPAAAR